MSKGGKMFVQADMHFQKEKEERNGRNREWKKEWRKERKKQRKEERKEKKDGWKARKKKKLSTTSFVDYKYLWRKLPEITTICSCRSHPGPTVIWFQNICSLSKRYDLKFWFSELELGWKRGINFCCCLLIRNIIITLHYWHLLLRGVRFQNIPSLKALTIPLRDWS